MSSFEDSFNEFERGAGPSDLLSIELAMQTLLIDADWENAMTDPRISRRKVSETLEGGREVLIIESNEYTRHPLWIRIKEDQGQSSGYKTTDYMWHPDDITSRRVTVTYMNENPEQTEVSRGFGSHNILQMENIIREVSKKRDAARDFAKEFESIMIERAVVDREVIRLVSWIRSRDEGEDYQAGEDFYTLKKYISEAYGLGQEGLDKVMVICEETMIQEPWDG